MVANGPETEPFVVADLPGLIEGAAAGAGLGHQFLRHVERCRTLVHLVDLSAEEDHAADELLTVERELAAFDDSLLERSRLIVGSKLDAAREERRAALRSEAERRGVGYLEISAVTGAGVDRLLAALRELLAGGDT